MATATRPFDRRPTQRRQSFPLAAVLQLAAVWAAMMACADGNRLIELFRPAAAAVAEDLLAMVSDDEAVLFGPQRQTPYAALLALAALSGLVSLIGAFIGLRQLRMWRSAAVGAVLGAAYGAAIFCVYVAPAGLDRSLSASAVLLVTTILLRVRAA